MIIWSSSATTGASGTESTNQVSRRAQAFAAPRPVLENLVFRRIAQAARVAGDR